VKEPLRCRAPAVATIQIDDANVRVTRWDFEPGAETGWHRHGMAYVRAAGVEHNVVNAGTAPMSFVETELKHLIG
jgi:quercetin dioxygenase-like cupin family protein